MYVHAVSVGRLLMTLVGVSEAPDIYTAAIGLYTLWLVLRAGNTVLHYLSQGLSTLTVQIGVWSLQVVTLKMKMLASRSKLTYQLYNALYLAFLRSSVIVKCTTCFLYTMQLEISYTLCALTPAHKKSSLTFY